MIRGIEGGIIPSLRQKGKMFYYHDMSEEQSQEFNPVDIGIEQDAAAHIREALDSGKAMSHFENAKV